ncbi:glycosyltransferase [Ferirhizobium litorale]|uniref:Glycosyltransferase n=1 Tax=Ferirhizobium litorale TaxID=2927786 RepID=A0AAE3QI75_9HYPH|nr:glycosyltransferase [Fererhizobium litorale]MDI7924420.1 glycosyltransferase [Fererhizobium litorale]
MRVAMHTFGTRGDVQPYVALAQELSRHGHSVQLAAPIQFESLVRERGICFSPLPGEILALLDTPEGKAAIAGGHGFSAGLALLRHVRPLMWHLLDEEWRAAQSFLPDAIVHHPKSIAAPHMAEALGCPCILASPLPGFTPTSDFPSPMLPFRDLGPLNRFSHVAAIRGADFLFGKMIGLWRKESLGLARSRTRAGATRTGTIYAYSPKVVPVPSDWGDDVLVSGYWFLDDEGWQLSDALKTFLGDGEPPVYVGFGSMPGIDRDRMTATVIEALARTGKRGLLASGGGALSSVGSFPHVHFVRDVPHGRLLPEVHSMIHHGGAGTTAAGLRAGKPMTVCPFFGDQPFWGRRVADLGVGPRPLDRRNLSVEGLSAVIVAMDDPHMRRRAAALGTGIREEDGIGAATRFIENIAGGSPKRS